MPEPTEPTSEDARQPSLEAVSSAIDCIEQDFRRLAATISRMLEILSDSEVELSDRISSMKEVADRGLELSRELTDLTRKGG